MAQHDYIIANQSGAAFRSDLNNGLAAIVSQNSGAAQPSTTYAYQWWADTTTGLLKIRNAANNAWITVGTLASANLGLLPLSGGTMTGNITFPGAGGLVSVGSLYLKGNDATAPVRFLDGASNQIAYISNSGSFTGQGVINLTEQCLIQGNNATTPIRFNDGAGNQIAYITNSGVINAAGLSTASLNGGPLAGFRNRIINGNFDFWQRGTSFSNPASNTYTADRWVVIHDGSGATRTISRNILGPGSTEAAPGAEFAFDHNQSVAGSGATFNTLTHRIEGVRTYEGQTVTLSFYARGLSAALTLPAIGVRQIFGAGGSASVYTNFVTSAVIAGGTFAKYTYTATVPSIAGKTIGTSSYLELLFDLPLNSTFYLQIASVQLEPGPVATPFEQRPIGTELALCQRYFCSTIFNNRFNAAGGGHINESAIYWPVQMRVAPTVTLNTTNIVNATATASSPSVNGARAELVSVAVGDARLLMGPVTASAEL